MDPNRPNTPPESPEPRVSRNEMSALGIPFGQDGFPSNQFMQYINSQPRLRPADQLRRPDFYPGMVPGDYRHGRPGPVALGQPVQPQNPAVFGQPPAPFGQAPAPFGQAQPPVGQLQAPFGQLQAPLGQLQPPFGQPQGPAQGQGQGRG
ncbi:hypothetical protein PG987_013394 [Apiospora arundinis]